MAFLYHSNFGAYARKPVTPVPKYRFVDSIWVNRVNGAFPEKVLATFTHEGQDTVLSSGFSYEIMSTSPPYELLTISLLESSNTFFKSPIDTMILNIRAKDHKGNYVDLETLPIIIKLN